MNLHLIVGPSALFYPETASLEFLVGEMGASALPVSLNWLPANQVYLDGIFETDEACLESLLLKMHAEFGGRHDPLLVVPKLGDGGNSTPSATLAKRIVASQLVEALHLHAFIAPTAPPDPATKSQHELAKACMDGAQTSLGPSLEEVSSVATHLHLLDPALPLHQPLWRNALAEEFAKYVNILFREQPVEVDFVRLKGALSRLLRKWEEAGVSFRTGLTSDEMSQWAQKSMEVVLGRSHRSE